jgi:hypothetical protein
VHHTATDSAAGFRREAAPFWLRRFQRQKLKRARNAVRGNNASQPVSIAKPSMMLSYDSLETGSSNSLRSTIQSVSFCAGTTSVYTAARVRGERQAQFHPSFGALRPASKDTSPGAPLRRNLLDGTKTCRRRIRWPAKLRPYDFGDFQERRANEFDAATLRGRRNQRVLSVEPNRSSTAVVPGHGDKRARSIPSVLKALDSLDQCSKLPCVRLRKWNERRA